MGGPNDRFKVYLMECYPINMRDNSTRFIKIGISKNVKRRLQSLRHSNPFILETIFTSPIHDHNAKRLEKWLHDHLDEHRLKHGLATNAQLLVEYNQDLSIEEAQNIVESNLNTNRGFQPQERE